MSAPKEPEGGEGAGADATIVQSALLMPRDATYERRADHVLWLLNNLHVPLTLAEMENSHYELFDVVPSTRKGHSRKGSAVTGGSRNLVTPTHPSVRGTRQQADLAVDGSTTHGTVRLADDPQRKYKFTEDTTFWTANGEYNVVFVIDMSQSMYALDPNTNNVHIQTALETLEKCLMGMVQPFVVHSALGFPEEVIEPHICASVVGYCPRFPGSYPSEKDRKKLPFCRTMAHAHMVTRGSVPDFMKSVRNFMFNYECEIQDLLGGWPPPMPPIRDEPLPETPGPHAGQSAGGGSRRGHAAHGSMPFEKASNSARRPRAGDAFTFTYDPDAALLHALQIADYFLKVMPEVCSPAFVYLTDGVMRSNFAISKAQPVTSSLSRRDTRCTFIQIGSCGGFTPETALGFVGDSELLLYLAASLDGHFVYASDCPDRVLPNQPNIYHRMMLMKETRLARTLVRHRYDLTLQGPKRPGDMPRERLDMKKEGGLQALTSSDVGFPWCAECKPPIVDTVTARYSDYNIPVSMGMLVETRMSEGFTIRTVQVTKLDREGLSERVNIKMELVWHPNITIIYRINNTHYAANGEPRSKNASKSGDDHTLPAPEPDSSAVAEDRGQRCPNTVDIVIRSYKVFTSAFLHIRPGDGRKSELASKAAMLHVYLKTMVEKDERLRQMSQLPSGTPTRSRHPPAVFSPPAGMTASMPPPPSSETELLASRVVTDEVDPSVFLSHSSWSSEHYHLYDVLRQHAKPSVVFKSLASFRHTTAMYINSDLIQSYVDGMDFTETAKQGQRIMNTFRAHVCRSGTWALLKEEGTTVVFLQDSFRQSLRVPVFIAAHWQMVTSWVLRVSFSLFNGTTDARKVVMDCLPTFSDTFWPEYRNQGRGPLSRAIRPLHLLPVDLDISDGIGSNLLSTRDLGDMHTYVLEWQWTYLAREGTREDLVGEGSDSEIVRQALHRLAITLGFHRLGQDFTLLNAKGKGTGLVDSPGASEYDSCITFYQEREGYDGEELVLAYQYQIIVDMKQSSVTARTWIEPWSARFIRMVFEDDFRLLAPLGTFQQILQPERCFQLKVPNLAEFHSRRMNMFSIIAVVNSSRLGLRLLQLPDVTPGYAVWSPPEGVDEIIVDDPTHEITPEPDPDEDLEIQLLDEDGNITTRFKATEYYKTHDRDETRKLAFAGKLRIKHIGSSSGRSATLLERFMLTLFDKNDESKYDPEIMRYRRNEYNPFILALINPEHPRKLFFSNLTIKWLTTGEFTMVAYRCFLEFALFKHCDAISVNAEHFNKLMFAKNIVGELTKRYTDTHLATSVPNELDEHLYMDKWYVIRLPNNTSFLMVIIPNMLLSSPNRHFTGSLESENGAGEQSQPITYIEPSCVGHRRVDSEPASPPVFTPALEESIRGRFDSNIRMSKPIALNAHTLLMECSMDNADMRRQVRAMDVRAQAMTRPALHLNSFDVPSSGTKVMGEACQGYIGQNDAPLPFTEHALREIRTIERMYSEAVLQTIYLALLLKRQVALDDLTACLQSTLWKKRYIDVDITAFLHSQDAARVSRDSEWQAQDRVNLQTKFSDLLCESFSPLPPEVNPPQGRYYYCKSTPDRRSELEICLQLAQNPLFINLQCSVEVLDSDLGHDKRLNMPIDKLPLSLEKLCEQANIPWRPPTDHFEPLTNVRVILHINCLYLPDETLENSGDESSTVQTPESEDAKSLLPKPDRQELENRSTRLFQKTMSLTSLVTSAFDPSAMGGKDIASDDPDQLPSAVIAKRHIDAQMATLKGLPHDQLELVRHCHRQFVQFFAQETLYALRDTKSVTVPLLRQVWHTIATTVDDEVTVNKFEFSHTKLDLTFLIPMLDETKRQHAVDLVLSELLKQDGARAEYPLGRLLEMGGIVYMRDLRSRSARIQARARMRARARSDAQGGALQREPSPGDLSDSIPSWFLIKPTRELDGVRILTHNYSAVTGKAADSVLAAARQLLMVALKAANTRLLLEEMTETHKFPDQLVLPDAARANIGSDAGGARQGSYPKLQPGRDGADVSSQKLSAVNKLQKTPSLDTRASTPAASGTPTTPMITAATGTPTVTSRPESRAERQPRSGDPFDIASVLKPYIPDSPDFYTCEEQFTSSFPLHPRISSRKAIHAVLGSGMINNRLVNQQNMFFVRDGDSIFYALLTVDRIPYESPFGSSRPGRRNPESVISVPTPRTDNGSPFHGSEAAMRGAHTVATTSPDPSAFLQYSRAASRLSIVPATADSEVSAPHTPGLIGHAPLVPISGSATGLHIATAPTSAGGHNENPSILPRAGRSELMFSGAHRYSDAEAAPQPGVPTPMPGSPSNRYVMSSLTNLERERTGQQQQQHQAWNTRGSEPQSPRISSGGQAGTVYTVEAGALHAQRLPHTVSIPTMPVFDNYTLGDALPAIHAEEKTVPCIVLHIYGVDKPRKEMTQNLKQQISERIIENVTMHEMSEALLRRVALNDHDMDFLFPKCNPEPAIIYLPLPRFVHDLDRLLLHMRQVFGAIVSPFPASDFLAKAMRRSYLHLRERHSESESDESDNDDDEVAIGYRVPDSLRDDMRRVMEGWEYDCQTPRRVPVERMTFLYNFFTNSGPPPPEMMDIGTGIAVASALPLTKERTLSKGIWERLSANGSSAIQLNTAAMAAAAGLGARPDGSNLNVEDALMISTSRGRRSSLAPYQHHGGSFSNVTVAANAAGPMEHLSVAGQTAEGPVSPLLRHDQIQRRVSYTPSPNDRALPPVSPMSSNLPGLGPPVEGAASVTGSPVAALRGDSTSAGRPGPVPLPASQAAGLFSEYLRQFKEARKHLRTDFSEFSDLSKLMDEQVKEFSGESVIALTLWSHAGVRIDRLSAYISRVYWSALGDYVSEHVLYPILSSGWGRSLEKTIRLPDPYMELDACIDYPNLSRDRTQPVGVAVRLGTGSTNEKTDPQARLALLRTQTEVIPKSPSTFTENTKKQVHAMEIARQMAQYWGRQEPVKSLRHHRQKLPRVTGISSWFSDELRGVLETMCPSMHPALFRLLENPLVLDNDDSSVGSAPKELFPAYTLRKPPSQDQPNVVYDVSALPKALKGTRQSFCIMCTLPLGESPTPTLPHMQSSAAPSQQHSAQSHRHGFSASRAERTPPSTQSGMSSGAVAAQNRRLESLMKRPGESGYQRPSARSTISGSGAASQGQLHGLGLQGWSQNDGQGRGRHRYSLQRYASARPNEAVHPGRRGQRLPIITERNGTDAAAKKAPPPSDYKPVADPETAAMNDDDITYYSSKGKSARVSTIAWIIIWLVGGELEMVGYNVSQQLWDKVCDQIKERLERESRRKQLLGLFASHMGGIFPGYDRQARHKGLTSTWLDRDVTRDLVNKFALLKQLTCDDQIHYFCIDKQISPDYMRRLGLFEGSEELMKLVHDPPVTGMTLNDSKTELALRQLQPDHLRWARKLTFVDYTQPYVDTYHPDTLFHIGSRLLRAYQGRIMQVLRYDELMKIAERWRQLALINGLANPASRMPRTLASSVYAGDTQTPVSEDYRVSRSASVHNAGLINSPIVAPVPAGRPETLAQAPCRGDGELGSDERPPLLARNKGKAPETATAAPTPASNEDDGGVTLDDIQMIIENARLLHFVCAPIPLSRAIKPSGTDQHAFERLFRVLSAMLQDLADNYIDYLCSTGYVVARRYEKVRPWKEALVSLGYSQAKIARFTDAILGESRSNSYSHSNRTDPAEALLPSIQIPGAYLFADTDRSNLVTDVEICPEMLTIRMHALSRFTSEWRSAVPGYVRSSVSKGSIKKFTFELSKYKKLLHVKSFVYDFQLRYVARMLKPVETVLPLANVVPAGRPPVHTSATGRRTASFASSGRAARARIQEEQQQFAICSSDSDLDNTGNSSSGTETSDSETSESDLLSGSRRTARSRESRRTRHLRRRTVAQALHVHIDLTIFLRVLSAQRYYSTRFSSRRLVRAQFPVMHPEMYEYFLDHCERYHFFTEGCRPPPQQHSHPAVGEHQLIPDLCPDEALHSGCYRMYEGALPESMNPHYDDPAYAQAGPFSNPDSYAWGLSNPTEQFPLHLSDSYRHGNRPISIHSSGQRFAAGSNIASSAPEPAWKLEHGNHNMENVAGDQREYQSTMHGGSGSHEARSGASGESRSGVGASGGRVGTEARRQMAASYISESQRHYGAPGPKDSVGLARGLSARIISTNRAHGAAPVTAGQYVNVHASENFGQMASSPLRESSRPGHGTRPPRYGSHSQDSGEAKSSGGAVKLIDYALGEYAACKIHLLSNDTSVRVILMAMTPDCDACRAQSTIKAQKRKERLYSRDHRHGSDEAAHRLEKNRQHHSHNRQGADHGGIGDKGKHHTHRRHHRKHHGGTSGSVRPIDDVSGTLGSSPGRYGHSQKHTTHPVYSTIPTSMAEPPSSVHLGRAPSQSGDAADVNGVRISLRRWMASLNHDRVVDPQADGLRVVQSGLPAASDMAQMSYYLIVDMDPQTTMGLSALRTEERPSRNGSLGAGSSEAVSEANEEAPVAGGGRTCDACSEIIRQRGEPGLCGIHKALRVAQVDMRDWENKGEVWANEPTMVMDVSTVDPDEFDKEDPDVLHWIKKTARRIVNHTALDYHRDFNWYLAYQHLRMADLPPNLAPRDIGGLVGFIERQSWVDVGATDDRVQKLLDLDISAPLIVESLQLRMRHLYLESTLLMTTLQATGSLAASQAPTEVRVPVEVVEQQRHSGLGGVSGSRRTHLGSLGRTMASVASLNATPPGTPAAEGLSRYSTMDQATSPNASRRQAAGDELASVSYGDHEADDIQDRVNTHVLPSNPLCPVAAIDVHGHVIPTWSSANIESVLRLLSPLHWRPSRKVLLDPAFQKVLSRYIRLDIIDGPWLCRQHRTPITLPVYNWSFEEAAASGTTTSGRAADSETAARPKQQQSAQTSAATESASRTASRRVQQMQEGLRYEKSSISSLRQRDRRGGPATPSTSTADSSQRTALAPSAAIAIPDTQNSPQTHGPPQASGARHDKASTPSTAPAPAGELPASQLPDSTDRFARAHVETLPGSLLIVDPDNAQFAARLLMLNPFAYHGILDLVFERSIDSGCLKLSQIRAVSRGRRRDGLYEYERKHINIVLSTISAVMWDTMTRGAD
ncbi:hypothetical protein GGF46_002918 [Coemansia sp. RSA 552]|nr:hypothetical protein GGF46_002918 [Coemansia sp. RSA 552]